MAHQSPQGLLAAECGVEGNLFEGTGTDGLFRTRRGVGEFVHFALALPWGVSRRVSRARPRRAWGAPDRDQVLATEGTQVGPKNLEVVQPDQRLVSPLGFP